MDLRYGKTGNDVQLVLHATLLQNELNSDVACLTTHVRTCLATNKVARFVFWLVEPENAQHRYSTRFAAKSQNNLHVFYCPFYCTIKLTNVRQKVTEIVDCKTARI